MPRKHLIADGISKKQQTQAKAWQKLAKEIKAAVKVGGPNIDANPRLKAAVDKALLNNLSKESIDRNINGGNKDPSDLVQLEYECYGPNGIQIVIKALSDNSNRTIANINGYLAKLHGEIAKTNSVKIFFDNYGVIILKKKLGQTKDNVEEVIIMNDLNGYVDSEEFEDSFEVKTDPSNDFYKIKDALKNNGFEIFDAEIKLVPQNYVSNLNEDATQRIIKFIDCCNEDDDIQSVVTNWEEAV